MHSADRVKKGAGRLFIVGTPIGNLEDITLRALRVLKEVDLIACEDTRVTRKLLNRCEISTRTLSYHKFNERQRSRWIIEQLEQGRNVALVTNAGMPAVSDPGCILVNDVLERGIPVEVIPGPSSISAAVALSGIDSSRFLFMGFLPHRRAERIKLFVGLKYQPHTLIFFESAVRIAKALDDIDRVFGPRKLSVIKELTKVHERVVRGTAGEIRKKLEATPRGEFVIVLSGYSGDEDWNDIDPADQIQWLTEELGIDEKEALKLVLHTRKLDRAETYRKMIARRKGI